MKKIKLLAFLLFCVPMLWARGTNDSSFETDSINTAKKGGIISAETAKKMMDKDASVILVDVRTKEEYDAGKIKKAVLLPYDQITEESAQKIIPSKDTEIIVYCRSGRRSAIAAESLRVLGYTAVYDMGGIGSWPYGIE